eukprot:208377_1
MSEDKNVNDSPQKFNVINNSVVVNGNKSPQPSSPKTESIPNNKNKLQNNTKTQNQNRNKTKNKNKNKNKRRKKKNAWNTPKNKSKFENIMNEQQTEQQQFSDPYSMYGMNEELMLEQQMILEAIAQSQQTQKMEQKIEQKK